MPYWQTLYVQPYHTICINTEHRRIASALMKYIDSTLSAEIVSSCSCIPAILPHPLPTTSDVKAFHLNGKHEGSALGTQRTVTANHFINVCIECESDCIAVARAYVFHGHSIRIYVVYNELDFSSANFEIQLPSHMGHGRVWLLASEFVPSLATWVCCCYIVAPKNENAPKRTLTGRCPVGSLEQSLRTHSN